MRIMTTFRLAAATVLATLGAACDSTAPGATPIEQTSFASTLNVDLARSTRLPSGMYVRDSIVGTGPTIVSGNSVSVRYAGYLADGRKFDDNPSPEPLFAFRVGAGEVIPGWDIGIPGMRVGGKRQLIIPSELAYGSRANGPIPPYAVLVFWVDAIAIN